MIAATGNRMTYEIARQSQLAANLAKTQQSISTGNRIELPSDDVAGATRVSRLVRDGSNSTVWSRNLDLARSLAAEADTALQGVSDIMVRARETMVNASTGTLSTADRKTQANALRAMAQDVRSARATQSSLGQPLFAVTDAVVIPTGIGQAVKAVDTAAATFGTLDQRLEAAAAAVEAGNTADIATGLDDITAAVEQVSNTVADHGLRAAGIDAAIDRLATNSTDIAAERSSLEDTDITTAVARLNSQTITLEAAQAAFARINRRSLFDILS